jgi:tripartite-type tricarboxylate transporter receptor subunit TctC
MRSNRRQLLAAAACLAAGSAFMPAFAQSEAAWPAKPIQIVVAYAPGGSADYSARQIGMRLERRLKQPVTIVNRPGASGELGVTSVARSPADGYTLLLGLNTELVILPSLGRKLGYSLDQFEPIALVGSTPLVLIGRKGFKAADFAGLVQEVKTTPGNYNFGGAPGSPAHISGEWLKKLTAMPISHVPYKGGSQAATDVAGGHLDFYFSGITPARVLIQNGSVRAYATTGDAPSKMLPKVPTLESAGLKDFVMGNWTALLAPKGTPAQAIALLKKHVGEILAEPDFRAAMEKEGIEPPSAEAPAVFLEKEERKYRELIETLRINAG